MAQWAQTIIAALVALAGGFSGVAWIGSRVGSLDSRLIVLERFANGHDDRWTREYHGVESRLAIVERDCGRTQAEYPIRMQGLERRIEVAEGLFQRFVDMAPLIRDSNDLQRQQIMQMNEAKRNERP